MISSIKTSKIPVATIVQGKAMSCGAILFSFGEEGRRFMDPNATLMIHDVSSGQLGKVEEVTSKEADNYYYTTNKENNVICLIPINKL